MVFNRNRITRTFNNTPKSNNVTTTSQGPNRISNVTTSKIDRPTNINSIISENKRTNSLSNSSLSISGGGNGQSNITEPITNKEEQSINSRHKLDGPLGKTDVGDGRWLDQALIDLPSNINNWWENATMPTKEKHKLNAAEGELNNITPNNTTSNFPESRTTDMYKEAASGTDFNSGTDLFARQNAHEKLHPSIVSGKPRPYVKGGTMKALGISSNDSMVWNLPGTKQGSVASNMQFQKNTKEHSGMVDAWQKNVLTNPSRDQASANTWLNQQLGKIDSMEGQDKNKQMFKKDLTARYDNLFNTRNAPFQSNNPAPVGQQGLTRDEKKALKAQAKKDEAQRALFSLSGQSGPPPQPTQSIQGPTSLADEYSDLGNRGSISFTLGLKNNSNKSMDGYASF
tara:strand:+ start:171 stop:1367 length:1197 start_codon:yes stop_codon:yes gene_type:complete